MKTNLKPKIKQELKAEVLPSIVEKLNHENGIGRKSNPNSNFNIKFHATFIKCKTREMHFN